MIIVTLMYLKITQGASILEPKALSKEIMINFFNSIGSFRGYKILS